MMITNQWITAQQATVLLNLSLRGVERFGREGRITRRPTGTSPPCPMEYNRQSCLLYLESFAPLPGYITVKEAAELLNVTPQTVARRCAKGDLEAIEGRGQQGKRPWWVRLAARGQ